MNGVCRIFGAGEYGPLRLTPAETEGDLILAADGGLAHLEALGLRAHLAVGDFDSLGRVPDHLPVLRHPPEKDDTDLMLAVSEGLRRGCRRFHLYGGLGGRLDHSLGNLHVLAHLAALGCEAVLWGHPTSVTALSSGTLTFPAACRGTVSVFAWGGAAEGVTLTGLRYPLTGGTLIPTHPLGVSNEFTGVEASVSVAHGTLLVLWNSEENPYFPQFK